VHHVSFIILRPKKNVSCIPDRKKNLKLRKVKAGFAQQNAQFSSGISDYVLSPPSGRLNHVQLTPEWNRPLFLFHRVK
jgi:hypothetical protein